MQPAKLTIEIAGPCCLLSLPYPFGDFIIIDRAGYPLYLNFGRPLPLHPHTRRDPSIVKPVTGPGAST